VDAAVEFTDERVLVPVGSETAEYELVRSGMLTRRSIAADLQRSLWLVGATAILLLIPFGAGWLVGLAPDSTATTLLLIAYLATAPFGVILLHFRVHRPRETRVRLAFITGIMSLILALAVGIGAWFLSGPTL
jgi:hypothetical protein